jgi:CRP-like cAMP-binding protein
VRDLASTAVREIHEPGSIVRRQGAPAGSVGVLLRGTARVEHEEVSGISTTVAAVKAPALLGESALLEAAGAAATVVAVEEAEVWLLRPDDLLRGASAQGADAADRLLNLGLVRLSPLLCGMGTETARRLLAGCTVERHGAGETILHRGDPGDALYVVREGRCAVLRGDGSEEVLGVLGPGDWFGELALLKGEARTATVRADTYSVLVRTDRGLLDRLLGEDPAAALRLLDVASERLAALASAGGV